MIGPPTHPSLSPVPCVRSAGRIRLLRHTGRMRQTPVSPASRNLALLDARAPLLCYLDADDQFESAQARAPTMMSWRRTRMP